MIYIYIYRHRWTVNGALRRYFGGNRIPCPPPAYVYVLCMRSSATRGSSAGSTLQGNPSRDCTALALYEACGNLADRPGHTTYRSCSIADSTFGQFCQINLRHRRCVWSRGFQRSLLGPASKVNGLMLVSPFGDSSRVVLRLASWSVVDVVTAAVYILFLNRQYVDQLRLSICLHAPPFNYPPCGSIHSGMFVSLLLGPIYSRGASMYEVIVPCFVAPSSIVFGPVAPRHLHMCIHSQTHAPSSMCIALCGRRQHARTCAYLQQACIVGIRRQARERVHCASRLDNFGPDGPIERRH